MGEACGSCMSGFPFHSRATPSSLSLASRTLPRVPQPVLPSSCPVSPYSLLLVITDTPGLREEKTPLSVASVLRSLSLAGRSMSQNKLKHTHIHFLPALSSYQSTQLDIGMSLGHPCMEALSTITKSQKEKWAQRGGSPRPRFHSL